MSSLASMLAAVVIAAPSGAQQLAGTAARAIANSLDVRAIATLPDSTFWPEGVDYDPASRSYFVASVRHRTLARVDERGAVHYLWPAGRRDLGAVMGVRVDTIRHVLWATTSGIPQTENYQPGDSAIAALLQIRLADGAIVRRWDVPPVRGGHVLGDLAIGPEGDVFVTDSKQPVLYRLRPGGDTLEHFSDPLFRSLQGMAPTPNGQFLYLSDYANGLLRVDLATRAVRRVADAPFTSSRGCDGIAWDRRTGTIIAVQNGIEPNRIVQFRLNEAGDRVGQLIELLRDTTLAPEPTIGTVVGRDFVFVSNSQWNEFDDRGVLLPNARLTRARLMALPIDRTP